MKYYYLIIGPSKASLLVGVARETAQASFDHWRSYLQRSGQRLIFSLDDVYMGDSKEYGLILFWRTP